MRAISTRCLPVARGIAVLFIAALVGSCQPPREEPPTGPAFETVSWETDGNGYLQYRTNDPAKLGTGSCFWDCSTNQGLAGGSLNPWTVEVTVVKISGAPRGGAGVVIVGGTSESLVRILLAGDGTYRIDEKDLGVYSTIKDWTLCPAIVQGIGSANTIKVVGDIGLHHELYFNSVATEGYDWPFMAGPVYAGFYAAVGWPDAESFPDVPLDVRFRMTLPILVPP